MKIGLLRKELSQLPLEVGLAQLVCRPKLGWHFALVVLTAPIGTDQARCKL